MDHTASTYAPARPSSNGFTLTSCKPSLTLQGEMRIYTHERTGAVLMHMACADNHKAFGIGFKTPPFNSSGVAHILEHSVLNGSKKYPVKEPFANLLRSSLQTFLNAMTFSDRTIYPFASKNEKDYLNILDVYLDAVLHPRIYEEPIIFEREGHHLELVDDQLTISGVVYNEMKGSMSSRYSIVYEAVNHALYDNEYGYNAGGAPEVIETLTYEQFCQFHRDHYHPSNSFSFVYGDIDIDLVTAKMDASFEGFDCLECDNIIKHATPFTEPKSIRVPFSASGDDDTSTLSYNYLLPDQLSAKDTLAMGVVLSAFADASSSKLQLRLLSSGLCTKCSASFDYLSKQPTISISLDGINPTQVDQVAKIVEEELDYTATHGLDLKLLEAYLNQQIFAMRSGDFEGLYKGLYLGLIMSNPMMFDQDPLPYLDYIQTSQLVLDELKRAKEGTSTYFDDLFSQMIATNRHLVICDLYPQAHLITQYNEKKAAELQARYEQMSEEERAYHRRHTEEIAKYATTPDSPEAEATIPKLERSDISMQVEDFSVQCATNGLYKRIEADGIEYLTLFTPLHAPSATHATDATTITREELPLLHLLSKMYGMLNTSQRSFEELDTATNTSLGKLNVYPLVIRNYQATCADPTSEDRYHFYLTCSAAYLKEHTEVARALVKEIMEDTQFDDHERIMRLLNTTIVDMQNTIPENGHTLAISRLKSYYSSHGALVDAMSGVEGFEQLKALATLDSSDLAARLENLHQRILASSERFVYLASEAPSEEQVTEVATLFGCTTPPALATPEVLPAQARGALNEGLAIQSEVQYVAQGGMLSEYRGYSGASAVAAQIVRYNHLWLKIRVEGGAYGCIPSTPASDFTVVSYRDPRIDRSYQTYQAIPEFLGQLELTDRELTDFIISTIAKTDAVLRPEQLADQSIVMHLSQTPQEVLTTLKQEIVECTLEQVRDCASDYAHVLGQNFICTAGSRDKLEEAQTEFSALVEVN